MPHIREDFYKIVVILVLEDELVFVADALVLAELTLLEFHLRAVIFNHLEIAALRLNSRHPARLRHPPLLLGTAQTFITQ